MKMKHLASLLLFAGLAIGTSNGQDNSRLNKATLDNDETPTITVTATYKHPNLDCNACEPARQAPELQDYHFRGLSGPEAFDEYLAMVGEILDTESHQLNSGYHASIQPLKKVLNLSFSQVFMIGSVFVTSLSVLLPLMRK